MDIDLDINQNHEKLFDKARAHHQNTSVPHHTSPHITRSESPTDSSKVQVDSNFHDDPVFSDQVYDNDDDDDDVDDDGSSDSSNREGFVKRRIARWERRFSQCDDLDVTAPVNQSKASLELRKRDLPAPVVIPPTFLHESVSFCENSKAANELSFIRLNVIQMKADFQMTELKLKYGKWQYDVNKGGKQAVRAQQKNPSQNWSGESTSLPDIPENMAARSHGDGIPSVAHSISLASFGNDGRRQDMSGHHLPEDKRILSSPGEQNSHAMMSQSTPSLGPYGGHIKVFNSAKTTQPPLTAQSRPANNYGLEEMELKLRNMNKPLENDRSSTQRTLVAPLKPFTDNEQISNRLGVSSGMESHGYKMDHQQMFGRSGTSNRQISQTIHSPRTTIQSGIPVRIYKATPDDYQRDCQQRTGRTDTLNMPTLHSIPSPKSSIQSGIPVRTNKAVLDGYQKDHQHRLERSEASERLTSNIIPSPSSIVQSGIPMGAKIAIPDGYQRNNQQSLGRSGTLNMQTSTAVPSPKSSIPSGIPVRANVAPNDYHRNHQERLGRSGTSNIQMSNTFPSPSTMVQSGIPMRANTVIPDGHQKDHQQRSETLNMQKSHSPSPRAAVQSGIPVRTTAPTLSGNQRDHQQRTRPAISNIQTFHSAPSTRTITQHNFIENAKKYTPQGYHNDQQHRFGMPEISYKKPPHIGLNTKTILQSDISMRANRGTPHGYQMDYQHNIEMSGTSNLQTTQSVSPERKMIQEDILPRRNQDEANLKIDRQRLLNDLSNFLLEDVSQRNELEEDMSSGVISDGSGYDYDDSWDMETSESPVDTNDIGTQFPYSDEGVSSQETVKSVQDEIQCLFDGSDEVFRSSDCTFDVCIQVSVMTSTKTMPKASPDALHTQDTLVDKQLPVEDVNIADVTQFDNLEVQEEAPSVILLNETGNTMSEKQSSEKAGETISHLNDSVPKNPIGVDYGNVLDKFVQELEGCNEPVDEQPRQEPETFSHVDEASANSQTDSSKEVVEEFVPCITASRDIVLLGAIGAHHDGTPKKPTQMLSVDSTRSIKKIEQTLETFSHTDETLLDCPKDFSKMVVDNNSSHDNSKFCAIVADHDDVFTAITTQFDEAHGERTNKMDTCNISERTHKNDQLVDTNLHISADDVVSDYVDPPEQQDSTTILDQSPIKSQNVEKKTDAKENVPLMNISHNVQCSADGGQNEYGPERLAQQTTKADLDGLHASSDFGGVSQPSSELRVSKENECDQADQVKEICQDQEPLQGLDGTNRAEIEEVVRSLQLPHDEKELKIIDSHHIKNLEIFTEELCNMNNRAVIAEQEKSPSASERPNLYDDKTPIQDDFCKVLANENTQSLNLSKLSSPVEEENSDLVRDKITAGSRFIESTQISSGEYPYSGSDHISHEKVDEAESRENSGRISQHSTNHISPNACGQSLNPSVGLDSSSFPTPNGDGKVIEEECPSPDCDFTREGEDRADTDHADQEKYEHLNISLDGVAEFRRNQESLKDFKVNENRERGPLSPRSKIPVPTSKLTRSKSCPTRNRVNGKIYKQNSFTRKDGKCTEVGAMNNKPFSDKVSRVDVNATSPTYSNSFSICHEKGQISSKSDKRQNRSRIPVPTSNFERSGSYPNRVRPRIVELNAMSFPNRSKEMGDMTASKINIGKTRSRDIDITEALAVNEVATTTAPIQADAELTEKTMEPVNAGINNPSLLPCEKSTDLAVDDKSLNTQPSETDEFIKRAKQILSKIPVSQTNSKKTQSVPLEIKSSEGEGDYEVHELVEEDLHTDHHNISLPENDSEFLSLEADAGDDTASETLTLHSENDLEIKSPLHDEVLRIEMSEINLLEFELDGHKSPKSRKPVLERSRELDNNDAPMEERSDPEEEEVVSDVSGKERSVARISPMPREDGIDLTPIPTMRKPFKSRIPILTQGAIKPTPARNYRDRSYSEADGSNAINLQDEFDIVRQEESDDTSEEAERDHHSEFDEERPFRRTQSSREVRPRGSYWAFKTSPSLAVSEFERSQTLRPSRSRNAARKSPAGTPRSTPRGTPRSTPRNTPRDTPRWGSLKRQQPNSKTPPTFKSRECAFVPLPEWNRLKEVLSSGEQSRQSTRPSSPSEFSYTSRRSSNEFLRMHSPKWETTVTTPKPSRWRVDGRVPAHLKKKYSSMNDMNDSHDSKDYYPSDKELAEPKTVKQDISSPWVIKSQTPASSSVTVPYTDGHDVESKTANPMEERPISDTISSRRRSPCASETTELPMSSTGDVSAIWTEDDTLQSSNFSLPAGAKKKSWKRRLSLRRKKSIDPSKEEDKEPEKREKKKRKNWLLRLLGIRK